MMSNIIPLRTGQDQYEANHRLRENDIASLLSSDSFLFVAMSPNDGSIIFNAGSALKLGDLSYMQKVFNIKCDDLIHDSMYGDHDNV